VHPSQEAKPNDANITATSAKRSDQGTRSTEKKRGLGFTKVLSAQDDRHAVGLQEPVVASLNTKVSGGFLFVFQCSGSSHHNFTGDKTCFQSNAKPF
jgi:hypothetical protein